ncbi:hypothetical protein NDN08_006730 [Rhodosorus marinus]|uniref:Gem-associated protein 2 n=1 Tax=Rhodosorus marinus TaxID=101924 RepID=A0AAV8UL68_9RHOD|nr:hypothetical protein NDN08_006730 [Rhodosorus marinus]
MDSDDSRDDHLMPRALYFDGQRPSEGPPQSAEEYLRQVHWEAQSMANVAVAETRERRQRESQADVSSQLARIEIPHTDEFFAKISEEQLKELLDEFEQVRRRLKAGERNFDHESRHSNLPKPENEAKWRRLCFEKQTSQRPTLTIVRQIDQKNACAALWHFEKWLREETLSAQEELACASLLSDSYRGEWLFALLATLETPLDADSYASMRSLLRMFSVAWKATESNGAEDVSASAVLSVFISILGKYFGQVES